MTCASSERSSGTALSSSERRSKCTSSCLVSTASGTTHCVSDSRTSSRWSSGTVKSTDTLRRTRSCESTVIVSTRRCRHAAWRVSSAANPTAISPARSSRTSPGQGCTQRALQRFPLALPALALDEDGGRGLHAGGDRAADVVEHALDVLLVHQVLHQHRHVQPDLPRV